jgi:hypothetical protein
MDNSQLRLPIGDAVPPMTDEEIDELRRDLVTALEEEREEVPGGDAKAQVRRRHGRHRLDSWQREFASLADHLPDLLRDFASGPEVIPERIQPQIEPVLAGTRDADLFRLATLLWSVPVSRGYGRRMRFIGVFALGDPVFNLGARDRWVGWSAVDRRARLVNVMDAFVVGAVPPYSLLLGGKLVFSLIASAEVGATFASRYSGSTGIISGQKKDPRLALVTVTSALGRSSLYNRLRLRDPSDASRFLVNLEPIGWTSGYGHFQVSDALFGRLRHLLVSRGHDYADGHQYGDGPNWRMRVMRVALQELALSTDLQRHGIERQIYVLPLATNTRPFLLGQEREPRLARPPVEEIGAAALERWVLPRSRRDSRYLMCTIADLEQAVRAPGVAVHPGPGCSAFGA